MSVQEIMQMSIDACRELEKDRIEEKEKYLKHFRKNKSDQNKCKKYKK